jgi:antibiotic biosynthesis monooxygenase (ABM) superfamily enzyme
MSKTTRTLTEGQRAYEARRAAKAGMSLEKWLASKDRAAAETARAEALARKAAEAKQKPPGFLSRWLDKAHKPL